MRIYDIKLILFLFLIYSLFITLNQTLDVYSQSIIDRTSLESDQSSTVHSFNNTQQNSIMTTNDLSLKVSQEDIMDGSEFRYPYDNNHFLPPYYYKGLSFSHYSNATFGIEFDFPAESRYSELTENNNELLIKLPPLSFDEIINEKIENTIQIKKYSLPYNFVSENNTILDFAKSIIGERMIANFDIITVDKVFAIKALTEDEFYRISYIFFIIKNNAYYIKAIIKKELSNYIYPQIDKMISSIKFVDKYNTENLEKFVGHHCKKNSADATNYVNEIQIPFFCPIPSGILIDDDKNIWFVSSKHGLLFQFDQKTKHFSKYIIPSWNEREVIDGSPSMVWSMKKDKENNIWFTDERQNSIWKFNRNYNFFERYIIPPNDFLLSHPVSFDFDSKGNIFFIQLDIPSIWFGNITEMRNGLTTGFYEYPIPEKLVKRPSTFYFGSLLLQNDTKLWASLKYGDGKGRIISLDMNKMTFEVVDLSQKINSPIRMTMDNSEKIWITDFESNRFFQFNPLIMEINEYVTSPLDSRVNNDSDNYNYFTSPFEIATGSNNTIWFTEYLGNKISQFIPKDRMLVEYWIPLSENNTRFCIDERNISFCGNFNDLSHFAIDGKSSVWFLERIGNNIGYIDGKKDFPFTVEIDKEKIITHRGDNVKVNISINPNQYLRENDNNNLTMVVSSSIQKNNMSIFDLGSFSESRFILDDAKSLVYTLTIPYTLKNGKYALMLGAGNKEITILKAIDLVISE